MEREREPSANGAQSGRCTALQRESPLWHREPGTRASQPPPAARSKKTHLEVELVARETRQQIRLACHMDTRYSEIQEAVRDLLAGPCAVHRIAWDYPP